MRVRQRRCCPRDTRTSGPPNAVHAVARERETSVRGPCGIGQGSPAAFGVAIARLGVAERDVNGRDASRPSSRRREADPPTGEGPNGSGRGCSLDDDDTTLPATTRADTTATSTSSRTFASIRRRLPRRPVVDPRRPRPPRGWRRPAAARTQRGANPPADVGPQPSEQERRRRTVPSATTVCAAAIARTPSRGCASQLRLRGGQHPVGRGVEAPSSTRQPRRGPGRAGRAQPR